jgi:hypothetical protein
MIAFGATFPREAFVGDEFTFLREVNKALLAADTGVMPAPWTVEVSGEGFGVDSPVLLTVDSTPELALRGENVLAPFVGNVEIVAYAAI